MIPSSILASSAVVAAVGAVLMMAVAEGGNYLACPPDEGGLDWCHDDEGGETGYCMIMSTSPSPYKSR